MPVPAMPVGALPQICASFFSANSAVNGRGAEHRVDGFFLERELLIGGGDVDGRDVFHRQTEFTQNQRDVIARRGAGVAEPADGLTLERARVVRAGIVEILAHHQRGRMADLRLIARRCNEFDFEIAIDRVEKCSRKTGSGHVHLALRDERHRVLSRDDRRERCVEAGIFEITAFHGHEDGSEQRRRNVADRQCFRALRAHDGGSGDRRAESGRAADKVLPSGHGVPVLSICGALMSAPCRTSSTRTRAASVPPSRAVCAAAMPAAWPVANAVPMTRSDANA